MGIYDSSVWISDLDEVISSLPELELLSDKTVLITGSTGLICSALVDVLIRWNEKNNGKIRIIAAGRNTDEIIMRYAPFSNANWFQYARYDASSVSCEIDYACDYIIHGASNASPDRIIQEPVETLLSNVIGLKSLLELALKVKSKRLLFISSSEVYGTKDDNEPYKEDEYGFIDLLTTRNAYSVGKRAGENLCTSYNEEYGVDTVTVRPGHVYGPTATKRDGRVSSLWAYACAKGDDIIMKSDGTQIRSYCYCLDCASALIKVLFHGKSTQAYNISNPNSIISIREMAEIVAKYSRVNLRIELPAEIEKKGFNPMRNSSLNSEKLESIGWKGLFDAEQGLSHTVRVLQESAVFPAH